MGSLYQPGMFLSSKKRKDKSVTFRLENKALRSLAAHFKNRTGGFRGTHAETPLLQQGKHAKGPRECCQRPYLCPPLYRRPGLSRDDRPRAVFVGHPMLTLPCDTLHWGLLGFPSHAGP